MPVRITKTGGEYRVSTPGGVKAKGTTREKAKSQERLLNAVEHGYKPTGNPGEPMKKPGKKAVMPQHRMPDGSMMAGAKHPGGRVMQGLEAMRPAGMKPGKAKSRKGK